MNPDSQEKYLELQMLNNQLRQIQQQMQSIEVQAQEMDKLSTALEEAKSIKKGQELLVPLGQGIFLRSKADNMEHVIISVGADVVLEKSFDEALEIVKKQQQELNSVVLDMRHEFNAGVQQLHELQHELSQMAPTEDATEKKASKKK